MTKKIIGLRIRLTVLFVSLVNIVNLADIVPLLPPIQSPGGTYVHTGEEWSFLAQNGDFLPNHVVDIYRQAIDHRVETNQQRNYPVSG
jgi:triacylglycerol lipase